MPSDRSIAYFSMEIALDPRFPTYSGGLGMLAGDTIRAAADLGAPMVAVTLAHRLGYFRQHLDGNGNQTEAPDPWHPETELEPVDAQALIVLERREVHIRAWRYVVHGIGGSTIPVYFLDTDVPANTDEDRHLTDSLYSGDERHRLRQEGVLGLGGIALLRALGYDRLTTYHMNEGHSALLTIALLAEHARERGLIGATIDDRRAVHQHCVFTTHTPVPAGHDRFPMALVRAVLGRPIATTLSASGCVDGRDLNMTELALVFSRYVNGVAMRHGEVTRQMFPSYPINAITNGVHAATWTAPSTVQLFDRFLPEWRNDNLYLRYAVSIPPDEIRRAHLEAKNALLAEIEARTARKLSPDVLTIGFARRATAYKRADMLFSDLERLRAIATHAGPLQIIFAGKAHPRDEGGKALIRQVFEAARALESSIPVVFLENYDMALARLMCAGVDLWLNTPLRPMEASGTSGMKAAINGVPSLSVLDGWWIEGHIEGITGWAIGEGTENDGDSTLEAASLYDKLERTIVPLFYGNTDGYARVMQMAMALNGSFFNTERMVDQYMTNAYRLPRTVPQ